MKNIIAAVLFCTIACMAAVNGSTTPPPETRFRTVTQTTSGSNKAATITFNYKDKGRFYAECADSVTLTLEKGTNGGEYIFLIKKTVSGAITVTTTASGIGGVTSPIAITGSTNTYHMLRIYYDGTVYLVHKE